MQAIIYLKKLARKLGLSVKLGRNARPTNLTDDLLTHPYLASFQAYSYPYFAKIPVERLIYMGYMAFRAGNTRKSPFYQAIKNYECHGYEYAENELRKYYKHIQFDSIEKLLGIGHIENKEFSQLPPFAMPHLAGAKKPQETLLQLDKMWRKENKFSGLKGGLDLGSAFFGPTQNKKIKIELERLIKVYKSICKDGYKDDFTGVDAVSGYFLVDGDDWRVLIVSGHHRVACLDALNYRPIAVQVLPFGVAGVIDRNNIEYIPLVQNNYLNKTEILRVFDRVFKGAHPSTDSL